MQFSLAAHFQLSCASDSQVLDCKPAYSIVVLGWVSNVLQILIDEYTWSPSSDQYFGGKVMESLGGGALFHKGHPWEWAWRLYSLALFLFFLFPVVWQIVITLLSDCQGGHTHLLPCFPWIMSCIHLWLGNQNKSTLPCSFLSEQWKSN